MYRNVLGKRIYVTCDEQLASHWGFSVCVTLFHINWCCMVINDDGSVASLVYELAGVS